jgi:pimeloyl-ACP methyl ester carboxylesterase
LNSIAPRLNFAGSRPFAARRQVSGRYAGATLGAQSPGRDYQAAPGRTRPDGAILAWCWRRSAIAAFFGFNPDLEKWLHRVKLPALVVWGDADKIMPPANAALWCERLPNARLVMVYECGHIPHVEHAALVSRHVREFLEGVAARFLPSHAIPLLRRAQAACQGVDRHLSKPPTFTARWRRSANPHPPR